MKKLILLFTTMFTIVLLGGCGNRTFIDTTYTFNWAQFSLPDGTVIEGKVVKWTDYDGEQIQLKMEDGNIYLVSTYNAVLTTESIDKWVLYRRL